MRRIGLGLIGLLLAAPGCGQDEGGREARPDSPPPSYTDVTAAAGIRFTHQNGAAGRFWMPETMGSGCAILDYDADDRPDLFLVDSSSWGAGGKSAPSGRSRLYRNLGGWRFQDVTDRCLPPLPLYGMGAAVADYDNDGWVDILVTGLGESRLLRNERGRKFHDATAETGLRTPGWPTSAAWLDFNRDGRMDLFVCRYVRWSPAADRFFSLDGVHKTYARPDQYQGESCLLLENREGRFVDVSRAAGILREDTKALGVALCDFDRDGWVDLAVSNDTVPNFLFHNQGNGTFKEVAAQAGVAVAEGGRAKAGMGIDVADVENSGLDAILITNFTGEQISLYQRDPSGLFMDVASRRGLGLPSVRRLGFGALFLDADLDGLLDAVVANGHIQPDVGVRSRSITHAQPALFFRGVGGGAFEDQTLRTGDLARPRVGRGLASGDLDGDGDEDLLMTVNGGAPALLRCEGTPRNNRLRLRLRGTRSNRSAIGAAARVRVGGLVRTRTLRSGSSYLSDSYDELLIGLGRAARAEEVEIRWPNGAVESFGALDAGRDHLLVEGRGSSSALP